MSQLSYGPFWIIAFVFPCGHASRTTGTIETTIWQPGFIQKVETARDDCMQARLNAGFFLHVAQQGDFID